MHSSVGTDQLRLLFETAAGMPGPATTRVPKELSSLSRLGLSTFDGGGRHEVTPEWTERLLAESPQVH